MTPQQVTLVQESFDKVAPVGEAVARDFYHRLFVLDPALKPLFKGDMTEQGQKLITMLAAVVRNLQYPERIVPTLRELALRHVGYGVRPEHYATVGAALLGTLQQTLWDDFTHDVAEAWQAAYAVLSDVMMKAAYSA